MYTYSTASKSVECKPGAMSDTKIIAALSAAVGDTVFCDSAGFRTVYAVERNRYRREVVPMLVAKDKFAL